LAEEGRGSGAQASRSDRTAPDSEGAPSDDASLLLRCQQGDERAWNVLVDRYERLVYSVALRTGLDREVAVDVFQQVWLELYRSIARIRDPKALPRWLIVSTRRLAYKVAVLGSRTVDGVLEEMVDPAALPDAHIEELNRRRWLEEGLRRLGDPCARLLRLLFLEPKEPSYQEIAQRTGLAIGSIGPIRARCLTRLRRVLETSP
jgi:RNA polymerase sigma factor (sigma-70 family)